MNIVWKYCYMFRPCWVIIRQSLHLYDTRYWVVYRCEYKWMIYTFLLYFQLLFLNCKNVYFVKNKIPINITFKICNSSHYFSGVMVYIV
jgi:hypothetical protein